MNFSLQIINRVTFVMNSAVWISLCPFLTIHLPYLKANTGKPHIYSRDSLLSQEIRGRNDSQSTIAWCGSFVKMAGPDSELYRGISAAVPRKPSKL